MRLPPRAACFVLCLVLASCAMPPPEPGCTLEDVAETAPASAFDLSAEGGTVVHRASGLQWQRCSVGQTWSEGTCQGFPTRMMWRQAQREVSGQAGDGWRLPTAGEFDAILEACRREPALNLEVFPDTPPRLSYWTAREGLGDGGGLLDQRGGEVRMISGRHYTATATNARFALRLVRDAGREGAVDEAGSPRSAAVPGSGAGAPADGR